VQTSGVAQLGLGHSYSRAKVKFNVHRVDNMIIQSIALLDQLDKDINTFSMRIRWVQLFKLFAFSFHSISNINKILGNGTHTTSQNSSKLFLTTMSLPNVPSLLRPQGTVRRIIASAY